MSKYIVTNSSHFKPFTYDELVKPIAQYTEAYNKSVEDTDALAMQAGAIGSMIDDKSTVARGLYDSFMSDTEGLVDDLASNGYNINTANQLSKLRRRYGQDITKINAAITNKAAAVKRYDDELSKDKTLITQIDPRTLSVDDWMENPYAGNYKSYSGTMLLSQASSLGENLRRDLLQNADKWKSILGGQYFERDTFTGFHANEVDKAIDLLNKGEVSNDSRIATLQNAMMTVYNSSGMSEWASPEQRAQALGYIGEGIYSAVGSHKSDTLKNANYIDAYHRLKLGGNNQQNYQPPIVAVRGSKLTGTGDPEGNTVLQALSAFNTLVKTNSHVDDKGNMTPAASAALRTLAQNKKEFQELTGIELTPELLSGDISQIITDAAKKISESATNDSYYNMQTTPGAAQNIATNIFRLNIDDLSAQGRKGKKAADSKAGAIAHYSNGKQLTASELSEILDSKNISVGFDAKTGELIIKKTGSESGEKTGQFNDRKVYLDKSVLGKTTGIVNVAQLQYALNNALPDGATEADINKFSNILGSIVGYGDTFQLVDLAQILQDKYEQMAVKGSDRDKGVYNALVDALALGMFDSSNTVWSPNTYKEGWSAKTGGAVPSEYSSTDITDEE